MSRYAARAAVKRPPNTGMEPTPLGVEQDRCDFEGWHRLDTRTDLDGGAADAQDVGAHQRSAISVREQASPLARLSNSSIAPSFSARSRGLDDR